MARGVRLNCPTHKCKNVLSSFDLLMIQGWPLETAVWRLVPKLSKSESFFRVLAALLSPVRGRFRSPERVLSSLLLDVELERLPDPLDGYQDCRPASERSQVTFAPTCQRSGPQNRQILPSTLS
jgi:hypothetical protein